MQYDGSHGNENLHRSCHRFMKIIKQQTFVFNFSSSCYWKQIDCWSNYNHTTWARSWISIHFCQERIVFMWIFFWIFQGWEEANWSDSIFQCYNMFVIYLLNTIEWKKFQPSWFFQFVGVEGFVTAFIDLFPNYFLKGNRREYFAFATCVFFCIAGLPMVTYVSCCSLFS